MIIGSMHRFESQAYDDAAGIHTFGPDRSYEVRWHDGRSHLIEKDEFDDMPLDDWRDMETAGWYYRNISPGMLDDFYGPFSTSGKARELARTHTAHKRRH